MLYAIEQWLQGVKNAAFEFRPIIFRTDAIPSHEEIEQALQMLSRLTKYGGFVKPDEETYTQVAEYALEHFQTLPLNDSQAAAARDAITNTLQQYYNYDPAIGNGVDYQMYCFLKTMRDIDKAIVNAHPVKVPIIPRVEKETVVVCTTPYYKHNEPAQQKFKYDAPKQETGPKNQGTLAELLEEYRDEDYFLENTIIPTPQNRPRTLDVPPEPPTHNAGFVPTSSMIDDLLADVDLDD